MPTLQFPLSRIEGHARVVIEVQGGKVVTAHFQATEFRGLEHLVKGVPAEVMVVIVPRICGVCSTAHHVAAVEALEDAYGITAPPLAQNIRELLLLGQLIQNQAEAERVRDQVLHLAGLAQQSGLDGVVCSAQEAADLRKR